MDHLIQSGETLTGISQKYGVSIPSILKANSYVTDPNKIYAGKSLVIPKSTVTTPTPTTTIQTTDAQRNADQTTQQKYDTIANAKGINTPTVATTGATGTVTDPNATKTDTTPSGRNPQDVIDTYYNQGITDPQAIYSKILNSNDPTTDMSVIQARIDTLNKDPNNVIKSGYNKQLAELDTEHATVKAQFDEMKKTLDLVNQQAIDSITSTFAVRRDTLKNNMTELLGAHEKMGYQTGGNRYTPLQQAGLLTNDENNYVTKLGELDAQEKVALLQASQAKQKGDWDNLSNTLTQYDKINDNRTNIIKNLATLAQQNNKKAEAEAKINAKVNLLGYSDPTKLAQGIASSIIDASASLTDVEFEKYINDKATEYKIKPDILKSAMLAQSNKDLLSEAQLKKLQVQTVKASQTKTSSKTTKPTMATIDFQFGKVPPVDVNGFLNPQAFQLMVAQALGKGLKRADVIDAVKGKFYLQSIDAYGLTPDEKKKLLAR